MARVATGAATIFLSALVFANQGTAQDPSVARESLDRPLAVIFAVDQSESTGKPSGHDIDGDGKLAGSRGFLPFSTQEDPDDSVFAWQLWMVRSVVEELERPHVRVGLVAYSGDLDPTSPVARTVLPLTAEIETLLPELEMLELEGPSGRTNLVAGIRHATRVFKAAVPAEARVLVLFADGQPTLPLQNRVRQNLRMAVHAARRAADVGVRVDVYSPGTLEGEGPEAMAAIAHATRGSFVVPDTPEEISRNLTTDPEAEVER